MSMTRAIRALLAAVLLLVPGIAPPPAMAALAVRFVSVTASVSLGGPVRVEIATVAGAVCDIEVRSPAGVVRTAGIRPKKALSSGRIVWLWRVAKSMRPGTWTVAVDCLLGDQLGRAEMRFAVKAIPASP